MCLCRAHSLAVVQGRCPCCIFCGLFRFIMVFTVAVNPLQPGQGGNRLMEPALIHGKYANYVSVATRPCEFKQVFLVLDLKSFLVA